MAKIIINSQEEYVIVLDYLPYCYHLEKKMMPIAQAIGETGFTLLQIVPRRGLTFEVGEKVYIGEGKFHACSRPYFCDEFRNSKEDKYIAIEINVKDLFEWKNNPSYPHKIAFRKGKILFECDKIGRKK